MTGELKLLEVITPQATFRIQVGGRRRRRGLHRRRLDLQRPGLGHRPRRTAQQGRLGHRPHGVRRLLRPGDDVGRRLVQLAGLLRPAPRRARARQPHFGIVGEFDFRVWLRGAAEDPATCPGAKEYAFGVRFGAEVTRGSSASTSRASASAAGRRPRLGQGRPDRAGQGEDPSRLLHGHEDGQLQDRDGSAADADLPRGRRPDADPDGTAPCGLPEKNCYAYYGSAQWPDGAAGDLYLNMGDRSEAYDFSGRGFGAARRRRRGVHHRSRLRRATARRRDGARQGHGPRADLRRRQDDPRVRRLGQRHDHRSRGRRVDVGSRAAHGSKHGRSTR